MKAINNATLKIGTLLTFCFLAFGTLSAQNMANVTSKAAVLSFKAEVIDYGTINQNDDGSRTFTFKNEGQAPLIISKVTTTCGCTVPTYSKEPIQPGDYGTIDIVYNTKKVGTFTKSITVYSNATEGKKTIKIKGKVVAVN